MSPHSMTAFALWMAKEEPDLFLALAQTARNKIAGLGDFSDVLSSIGDSLSTAASNVGTFLTTGGGIDTLTKLGSVYLQTQAQKSALAVQTQLAQMGRAPAAIQTVYNPATGQYQAVVNQTTGGVLFQQPLTPQVTQSLLSGLPTWWPIAALGAGALLLFLMLRR